MAQEVLQDGFVKVCIDPSLNYYDGKCRIIVEGQYIVNGALATPIVADKPMRITSTRDLDSMFTAGSILAEGLKTLFCSCPSNAEVYAIPRADAGTAVKAVYTMTVTGPATSDGALDIFLGNRRFSIESLPILSGDTATAIAAAIVAALPANFPYTAVAALGVITFTAKNGGTIGNYLNPIVNWKGLQNRAPNDVTITTTRPTAGANNPAPINYANALGECCYDVFALLTDDRPWQRGLKDYIATKWSCDTPQCFGHGYTFNSGTIGQVLAAADNSAELSRVAVPLNPMSFPWERTINYAARSVCSACDSPELNIQGKVNGLLQCVYEPASCGSDWTFDETVQLKENGFVVMGPTSNGFGQLSNIYVYNDVTNYLYDDLGRPNATFRDASSRRMAKKTAVELATRIQLSNGLSLFTRNTRIAQGTFGTTKRLLLADIVAWAKSQVGILFSEFENIETDIDLKEDFELAAACQGIPCKLHLNMRYRRPCRLASVNVNLQPKELDNCLR
ncbi:MAG: hypothetical protein ACRCYS_17035 [Beijerinckiaceae bacterium]